MRELSYPGHVVPKLSVDGHALPSDTLTLLDREHLAHPSSLLAKLYWDVVEILDDMLDLLAGTGLGSPLTDPKHRAVLRHAELLMLRSMSLHEYLGELLITCAPASAKHELGACRKALANQFGRDIRVPLNKVKHNGFTLAPITMTNPVTSVPGFVVHGPIGEGMAGPLSFSEKHGANTREGYSLPLFMRRAFALLFELTDLALEPLVRWGAIRSDAETRKAHNPNDARMKTLPGVVERLNALPRHGFMGEHETPSPVFDLGYNSLFMELGRTKKLRGHVRLQFQIPAIHQGAVIQMPYWSADRSKDKQ